MRPDLFHEWAAASFLPWLQNELRKAADADPRTCKALSLLPPELRQLVSEDSGVSLPQRKGGEGASHSLVRYGGERRRARARAVEKRRVSLHLPQGRDSGTRFDGLSGAGAPLAASAGAEPRIWHAITPLRGERQAHPIVCRAPPGGRNRSGGRR